MLLSKLKHLNPNKITHHFSKLRLGFCGTSNFSTVFYNGVMFIDPEERDKRNDEIVKHVLAICNHPHWNNYHRGFIVPPNPSVDLYNNVIRSYYRIGIPKGAKRVFSLMKEKDCSPDWDTYKIMISECFKRGKVDEALNLENEMLAKAKGMKLDVKTYVFIIEVLTSCNRFKEAIKVIEGMKDDGVLLNASCYHYIIRDLCRLERFEEAIKVIEGMKDNGVWPNANCYYYIIRDLCRQKRTEEAWDVIAQMVENEVNPGLKIFQLLRSAYDSLDSKENVRMYFKELIAHGIIPDQGILATLFESPFGRGNTREVLSILLNVMNDSIRCDDLFIYNDFIQKLLRYDEIDLAMELLSETRKRGFIPDCDTYSLMERKDCSPDWDTYKMMIGECFKQGKVDEALNLVNEMLAKAKGMKADVKIFVFIIKVLSGCGRFEEAIKVVKGMKGDGVLPNANCYYYIIRNLCRLERTEEAVKVIKGMKDDGVLPNASCYNYIIRHLCRLKRYEEAIKVIDNGVLLNANCYYYIIRDLCRQKRTEDAWDAIAQMVKNKVKPNEKIFQLLRSAYDSLDSKENVRMYFKELIAHGIIPDQGILETLFESPFGRGNTREVLSILLNVINDSILCDNLHIYNVFIQKLLQYDEMDLAMELLSETCKRGFIPDRETCWLMKKKFDEEKVQLLFNEMKQRNDATSSEMIVFRICMNLWP